MIFSACFVTLWSIVLGRPATPKLGVDITQIGKLTIGVDGEELRYSLAGCTDAYKIWYPTTTTGTEHPGFCVIGVEATSNGRVSRCPLNLDSNRLMEIEVEALPPGCTVSLINAFLPHEDGESSGGVPLAAILVPSVIGAILLLLGLGLLGYFVFRPCYKRRKAAARTARAAQEIDAQPAASDSLPTALPPTAAPPSSAAPEAKPAPVKKPSTEQASTTPAPSSSAVPEKKPSIEKSSFVPAAKDAPPSIDEFAEAPKPKSRSRPPPHWNDREGHLSAARIHESYEDVRSRGSRLSKRTGKSRKSKADSLDERRKHFETAVECLGRHQLLEQFKNEEMIVSRTARNDGPTEFIRMQKYYNDDVVRVVDEREKRLLVSPVGQQFKLVEEFGKEAAEKLKKTGAELPANGQRASFTDETRKFLMEPTTPTFIQMFAFAAEYGWVIPVVGDVDLNKLFLEFSVQTLLVVALHPHFPERTRRKALAYISRKSNMLRAEFEASDFARMAYPLRLLPEALTLNGEFFKHMDQVKTYSIRSLEERKKAKKCGRKDRSTSIDDEKRSKEDGKQKCAKKRPSASRTSASKTSMERSTESKQEKQK